MPTETPRSSSRPSHKDLPPLVPSGLNAGYYHLPLPNIEPVPTIEPVQQAPTPSDTTPGMEASPSPPARRPSSRASPIAENEIAKATMGVCVIEGCEGTDQKRKVVSQFFGRNKSATMNLPDAIYMPMCRRHYQRTAYKDKQRGKWCSKQAQMVARVFDAIDKKGVEQRWTIKTSKGIKDTLDDDNERNAAAPRNKKPKRSEASNLTNSQREKLQDLEAQCPEARKLLHLCGQNKSTKEATEALTELHQASMKEDMPDELIHFEFLAQIDIREAWTEAVRRDSQ
ncbi:MAG: hypothetical protein M1828_007477 [Chrysothrix sp. TS-e1954]|nr:MAG: hypothetical protein M1828_007477 [Chrysothrix sp. TS-e1954]